MRSMSFVAISCVAALASCNREIAPPARVVATFTLPALPLGKWQNERWPKSIEDDRGFMLGGAGSDLWHGPGDDDDEFWLVTDRGPNGQITVGEDKRRTFHVPDFTPHILHVRARVDTLEILSAIPLATDAGAPATGRPNVAGHDEAPYDASGATLLELAPSGIDSEGLARTKGGEFWLAEEYAPSLVRVSAQGHVLERFVPRDSKLADNGRVSGLLPAVFGARKSNRGFESLALRQSGNHSLLSALMQSPLCVPDKDTAEASRNARLLVFDLESMEPCMEFVYVIEEIAKFAPGSGGKQDDMKLSGLVALDDWRWLVLERTDAVAKLVVVAKTEETTDIYGTKWDDAATSPSLEASADLAAIGVTPLVRERVIDLSTLGLPPKIEGVAVLGPRRVAVVNDNDFDVGALDADGKWTGQRTPTRLFVIELAEPLY